MVEVSLEVDQSPLLVLKHHGLLVVESLLLVLIERTTWLLRLGVEDPRMIQLFSLNLYVVLVDLDVPILEGLSG
jgi:hypothetical protein